MVLIFDRECKEVFPEIKCVDKELSLLMEIGKEARGPLDRILIYLEQTNERVKLDEFKKLMKFKDLIVYDIGEIGEMNSKSFHDVAYFTKGILVKKGTIDLNQVNQYQELNRKGCSSNADIILQDQSCPCFFNNSMEYLTKNPVRLTVLREVLDKLVSNWNSFKKNQMDLQKLVKSLKNICKGHFNSEDKKLELKENIPDTDEFIKFTIKELFTSGILKNWLYKSERPLEDYSIESLEKLATEIKIVSQLDQKDHVSEVNRVVSETNALMAQQLGQN